MAIAQLADGRFLYYNGIEGNNHSHVSVALEYGNISSNSQSRVLDMRSRRPRWSVPVEADGGANPNGISDEDKAYLPGPATRG